MSKEQQMALLECDRVFNELHLRALRSSTPKASLEELLVIGDGYLIRDNEKAIARVPQYEVLSAAISKTTNNKLKQTLYEASLMQADAPIDVLHQVFSSDDKSNEAQRLKWAVLKNPSIPVSVMIDAFRGADFKSMFAVIQNPALPADCLHEAVNHHLDVIVETAIKNPSIDAKSLDWVLRQRSERFIPIALRNKSIPHSYLERFSHNADVEILKSIVINESTPESILRAVLENCHQKTKSRAFNSVDTRQIPAIRTKAYSHKNWNLTLDDLVSSKYVDKELRSASLNPNVNQEFIEATRSLGRDTFAYFAIQSEDVSFLVNEGTLGLAGFMNPINIASLSDGDVKWLLKKRPSPERAFIMLNVSRRQELPYDLRVKAMVKAINDLSYSEADSIGVAVFHYNLKMGLDALGDLSECKREITSVLDKTGISLDDSYREYILSELLNSSARALSGHTVENNQLSRRML